MPDLLYKITGPNREAVHSTCSPRYVYPEVGRWTSSVREVEVCRSGYHLVNLSGIGEWVCVSGVLWIAEGDGASANDGNKTAFARVRLLEQVGVLSPTALQLWSADCAERVVHLTAPEGSDVPDPRSVAAIEAARKFARGEISQEELDAAWEAAWDAAWNATKNTARAAARAAAGDDAWNAARAAAVVAVRAAARDAEMLWQNQRLLEILRSGAQTEVTP